MLETCTTNVQLPSDSEPQVIEIDAKLSDVVIQRLTTAKDLVNKSIPNIKTLNATQKYTLKTFIERIFNELASDECNASDNLWNLEQISQRIDAYTKGHIYLDENGRTPLEKSVNWLNTLNYGITKEHPLWILGKTQPDL